MKQKLHDLTTEKSKSYLELEEKLNMAEESNMQLREKNNLLTDEITLLQNKLESQHTIKEDLIQQLIQQCENEKRFYSTQNNNLISENLNNFNKINKLETELSNKMFSIEVLTETKNSLSDENKALKTEIENQNLIMHNFKQSYEELVTRLSEQEATARHHLQNLFKATQTHTIFKPTAASSQKNDDIEIKRIDRRKILPENKFSVSLQVQKMKTSFTQQHKQPIYKLAPKISIKSLSNSSSQHLPCTNSVNSTNRKSPPMSAFIRPPSQTIEEFFNEQIGPFKQNLRNRNIAALTYPPGDTTDLTNVCKEKCNMSTPSQCITPTTRYTISPILKTNTIKIKPTIHKYSDGSQAVPLVNKKKLCLKKVVTLPRNYDVIEVVNSSINQISARPQLMNTGKTSQTTRQTSFLETSHKMGERAKVTHPTYPSRASHKTSRMIHPPNT